MPSEFMNKNVNILLLILIIIVIGAITGGTVYFQDKFYNMTTDYNDKSAQLKNKTEVLNQYMKLYNEAVETLNVTMNATQQEKEDLLNVYNLTSNRLGGKIDILNNTLESTERELESTQDQLVSTNQDLLSTKNKLSEASTNITRLQSEKQQFRSLYLQKEDEYEDLQNDYSQLQSQYNQLSDDCES